MNSLFLNDLLDHDNHCRLTVAGQNWWIVAIRGPFILLTNETGRCILDTSSIDWGTYVGVAAEWLRQDTRPAA